VSGLPSTRIGQITLSGAVVRPKAIVGDLQLLEKLEKRQWAQF
jgi:hypothetical protein